MEDPKPRWTLDPKDPRAPTQEMWDAMSESERVMVDSELPASPWPMGALPGEGDVHRKTCRSAGDALDHWFSGRKTRAYVGQNMAVYYPGARTFVPDIFVALDAEPGERRSWNVANEGQGLDVAIEIHYLGNREKDVVRNVEWFARLGITEYYVFEVLRLRLSGWRLAPGQPSRYVRMVPQLGSLLSTTLDLELTVEGDRLRFYSHGAALPDHDALVERLATAVDTLTMRAQQETQRAEQEAENARQEAENARKEAEKARKEAEKAASALARIAELEAELRQARGESE